MLLNGGAMKRSKVVVKIEPSGGGGGKRVGGRRVGGAADLKNFSLASAASLQIYVFIM